MRGKCVKGCIFAPYFDSEQPGTAHFAAVHKVFGTSNASKLLQGIPVHRRLNAVLTLCYEALARVRDPVYGCVAHIFSLQQQICRGGRRIKNSIFDIVVGDQVNYLRYFTSQNWGSGELFIFLSLFSFSVLVLLHAL
ncbi:LOB domain-containing protein 18 [Dionaea muscipula]